MYQCAHLLTLRFTARARDKRGDCKGQRQAWSLVSENPGLVLGPTMSTCGQVATPWTPVPAKGGSVMSKRCGVKYDTDGVSFPGNGVARYGTHRVAGRSDGQVRGMTHFRGCYCCRRNSMWCMRTVRPGAAPPLSC